MAVKAIGKEVTRQLQPKTLIVLTVGVAASTVIINSLRKSFPKFDMFMSGFDLPFGN